ncbi:MAG: hypothetical protein ACR2N5_08725 [Solirubrobacterales bacterium]
MRVAFLATDSPHHTYLVWRAAEIAEIALVVLDNPPVQPSFETAHPYEDEQGEYERAVLLDKCPESIAGLGPTFSSPINDSQALQRLVEAKPDLVIDIGTGIIRSGLIETFGEALLTAHAGNPEEYRGIDALLWPVYNRDFDKLAISLLAVDPALDAGAVIKIVGVEPGPDARLHQLRSLGTLAAAGAIGAAVATMRGLGRLPRRRQVRAGRYYSWMPASLKGECVHLYEQHYAAS